MLRKSDKAGARKLLILGSCTALVLAAVLYGIIFGATDALVGVFNSENSTQMAQFAHMGMRLYFVGYFFAGFNIVAAGYLSATNRPVKLPSPPSAAAWWPSWSARWC